MLYIVYVEWGSTKGNHAGMAFLAKELNQAFPKETNLIKIPVYHFHGGKYVASLIGAIKLTKLLVRVKKKDSIFLMEYLPSLHNWAYWIKKLHAHCHITAIAHFVNEILDELYPRSPILLKHASYVDRILVLGHSLKKYLVSKGVDDSKVVVTYHYVDTHYYSKGNIECLPDVQVIFMGSLKRDYDLLKSIIQKCPTTHFHLLMGRNNLRDKFSNLDNVTLHPYLEENELRSLMQKSDISLNVMKDTIGSNVIVTSMASGLAMVVSDVGSIHDYCDERNSVFCTSAQEFSEAIKALTNDRELLAKMKEESWRKAQHFSLDNFKVWFKENLLK